MAIKPVQIKNLSILQQQYRDFWTIFNERTSRHEDFKKEFNVLKTASIRTYQDLCIRKTYLISLKIDVKKEIVYIGAYFNSLTKYSDYYKHHIKIENLIGEPIEWTEHSVKASAYISKHISFENKNNFEEVQNYLIDKAILVKKVFEKFD